MLRSLRRNVPVRLAVFVGAAVVALAAGAAVGTAVGPIDDPAPTHPHREDTVPTTPTLRTHPHARHDGPDAGEYRIEPAGPAPTAGTPAAWAFRVLGPDGTPVTRFETRHERPLHLIVVSSDTTTYAHVHPDVGRDGRWTVDLPALAPGGYRLVADTVPVGGPELALVHDLVVPGVAVPREVPDPQPSARTDAGLEVDLGLRTSEHGTIAIFTVRRDGVVVRPDPYLGARGHLVAFATRDLAYVHVHPEDHDAADEATESVAFTVSGAPAGRHRLFFDFSVDGVVHTAAFTVDLPAGTAAAVTPSHTHAGSDEDGHR